MLTVSVVFFATLMLGAFPVAGPCALGAHSLGQLSPAARTRSIHQSDDAQGESVVHRSVDNGRCGASTSWCPVGREEICRASTMSHVMCVSDRGAAYAVREPQEGTQPCNRPRSTPSPANGYPMPARCSL